MSEVTHWFLKTILTLTSFASVVSAAPVGDKMNGYTLRQFGDFAKDWRLVTVRFRQDTAELRFVYANALAWKTLSAGRTDYADGAAFAKIGTMTVPDPLFASSAVPGGARRVQIMVRDMKKHAQDDGWGYALFDPQGKIFPGPQRLAIQACVACHRLARERGGVFSQLMTDSPSAHSTRLEFEDGKVAELPKKIRALLPGAAKKVRVVRGELSENLFFGTLDEIQPALARESLRAGSPALLMSRKSAEFSLVIPWQDASSCDASKGERPLKGVHTLPKANAPLMENIFCQVPAN